MSYLRLLEVALRTGRVTRRYPKEEPLVTEDFRGSIEIDPERCWGCGACALACPPNALSVVGAVGGALYVEYFVGRCIFCGRCAEVCPRGAVTVTRRFELASDKLEGLRSRTEVETVPCSACGRPVGAESAVETVCEIAPALKRMLSLCPDCRSALFAGTLARAHPRKALPR